jgi:hypothetical protein
VKQPTVWLRRDGITLVGCLFLLLLLTACTTPFINLDMKVACTPGGAGGGSEDDSGPGACRPHISYSGDAFNFHNTETKANITDHAHICTSPSWKCQATPGKCYIGGPNCKSYFTPSSPGSLTGGCDCGCPP